MWSWAFLCHWSFWQWLRKLRMQTEIRGGTQYAADHSDCWTAVWLHGGRLAWKHYVRVCERREDSHQREKITLRVLAQCYWLEYTPYDFWRYCGGRTLRDRIDTTLMGGSIQSCPSPTPLSSTLNTESFSFPVWLMFQFRCSNLSFIFGSNNANILGSIIGRKRYLLEQWHRNNLSWAVIIAHHHTLSCLTFEKHD